MKFDHKVWAVLIIAIGAVVAVSYSLGIKKGTEQSAESLAVSNASSGTGPATPAMLQSRNEIPLDHPQVDTAAKTLLPAAAQDSRFTHFRVGNRNVKGMFLDQQYAWIGTSGGVIRYNLSDDTHVVFDNTVDGILSNGIFHISNIDGRIFAGTYGGGLSVYEPQQDQWTNYNIPQGLADQFVYDVHQARNGDLWIATWSGANRIKNGELDDPAQWTMFDVENTQGGLPNRWVYALDEGPDGSMWLATEEGLAHYREGRWRNWQHSDGLGAPYAEVKEAIKSTSDPAKASQHHAHNKADQGLQEVTVAYNPNYIISLKVDKNGIVWCGTWGAGLARFDGQQWTNYTTADGLPANHIFMLHIDKQDQLWIGTNHGLAKMRQQGDGFDVMTTADGLFANNVFSMAQARDGTLWVGSFGGVARIAKNN